MGQQRDDLSKLHSNLATARAFIPLLPDHVLVMNLFLPLLTAISDAGSPSCSSLGCGILSRAVALGVSSSTVGRNTEEPPPTDESIDWWRLLDLLDGEDESVLKRVPP